MRGQKGQMHPAFNFKVCVMVKDCEEEGDGQPVNPEPEAKAAERALPALTAPFIFTADKHIPMDSKPKVCTKYRLFAIIECDLNKHLRSY